MKEATTGDRSRERVKVTQVRSAELEEIYVTAVPHPAEPDAGVQTRSLYTAVLAQLGDVRSLHIVAERVFGLLTVREEFLAARAETLAGAGLSADTPVTYLQGAPVEGEALAGIHLTLVRTDQDTIQIEPIREGERTWGFSVRSGAVRRVFLASVHGLEPGKLGASPTEQAQRMFERADNLLRSIGLTYYNVVCTRIYLKRLLEWYDEFNGVRNPFYEKLGLLDRWGPSPVPASTGIQGKISEDCECVMDVLAVSTGAEDKCPFVKLHNPLQDEATDYGSAFARGVRVDLPGVRYVLISGTASIDEEGKTAHAGDPLGQIRRTMANFEAILNVGGATPADLYHAIWYCKHPSYGEIVREEMRRQAWPAFPFVIAQEDVCRHDLLVEIDGSALIPSD